MDSIPSKNQNRIKEKSSISPNQGRNQFSVKFDERSHWDKLGVFLEILDEMVKAMLPI